MRFRTIAALCALAAAAGCAAPTGPATDVRADYLAADGRLTALLDGVDEQAVELHHLVRGLGPLRGLPVRPLRCPTPGGLPPAASERAVHGVPPHAGHVGPATEPPAAPGLAERHVLVIDVANLGISFGVNSILLHNSRGAESQADEVGTYVLYHAGYYPHAMAQFFEIIEKKYPQRTIQFFSDHPVPENRIKDVDAEIPELGPPLPGGGKTDSPEFEAVKKKLLGMPPPPKAKPAPSQPQSGGNPSISAVMPSGKFLTY